MPYRRFRSSDSLSISYSVSVRMWVNPNPLIPLTPPPFPLGTMFLFSSLNRGMNKEDVVHINIYNGVSLSHLVAFISNRTDNPVSRGIAARWLRDLSLESELFHCSVVSDSFVIHGL